MFVFIYDNHLLRLDVNFFSATMYYLFPSVENAAITKVGTLIANKLTINKIGYYKILNTL